VAAGRSEIDCGCSFGAAHRALGLFQMLRTAMLALLGFAIAFAAAVAPGALAYDVSAAAIATQLLAGVALLMLYVALDQVMGLQPLRTGVQS
jgi:Methylamine utilisation protein MauE